ncbi:SIS domain-containing protein [Streptomyces sp. ACA25]|uniref:SIS domain-containing protein n=1 Tax=Streptomyces sp. ACA25 TaxID=3022596 RepID=UPI0023079759|nr:SIS domain-containing protein [Streptomyces sp. ACA25]MDB1087154.1 SIS domain-containing protein [Streptomyces sp. ACA25]
MIDESLLDAPDGLARVDLRGLLRSVAASGAQVRTAARGAAESGIAELRPEGRPGTVLVAGPGPEVPLAADLLDGLTGGAVRVTRIVPEGPLADPGALRWPLPRWAGPLDLLLLTSTEGGEAGLTDLLERAYRRGCSVVSVAPAGTPLAESSARRNCLTVPLTRVPHEQLPEHPAAPGPQWALLTPLLFLGDRLGLWEAGTDALHALADRLDRVAERCGPAEALLGNPAKTMAIEFTGSLPLLWSEGPLARAAARHGAATLTALPGVPALTAELPEALTAHGPLLTGNLAPAGDNDPDDFFRDRVDETPALHARVVLLGDPLAENGGPAGRSALPAARHLAEEQGTAVTELAATEGATALEAAAEFLAQLDFTAVYLTITQLPRP